MIMLLGPGIYFWHLNYYKSINKDQKTATYFSTSRYLIVLLHIQYNMYIHNNQGMEFYTEHNAKFIV